jgi:hypothetical protein
MDLLGKLPGMSDDALSTLKLNADRCVLSGTPSQQAAAWQLLPAIKAELQSRIRPKPVRIRKKAS